MSCEKVKQDIYESLDAKALSSNTMEHLNGCAACKSESEILERLASCNETFVSGSDFSNYAEIKSALIKRLEISVLRDKTLVQASKSVASEKRLDPVRFLWRFLVPAFAMCVALFFIFKGGGIENPKENSVSSGDFYRVSKNGAEAVEYSVNDALMLAKNETAHILMSDSSEITLKGPSKIDIYGRNVNMSSGKAVFKVSHLPSEEPFTVSSPLFLLTVLGTEFICDVSRDSGFIEVLSGKVKVESDNGRPKILEKGQSLRLAPSEAVKYENSFIDGFEELTDGI